MGNSFQVEEVHVSYYFKPADWNPNSLFSIVVDSFDLQTIENKVLSFGIEDKTTQKLVRILNSSGQMVYFQKTKWILIDELNLPLLQIQNSRYVDVPGSSNTVIINLVPKHEYFRDKAVLYKTFDTQTKVVSDKVMFI